MSEPKYVAETLAWCNRLRKADGKPPLKRLPKGKRQDPGSCPCGEATGWKVYVTGARRRSSPVWHSVPRGVTRFVAAFDNGLLPQYEAKP